MPSSTGTKFRLGCATNAGLMPIIPASNGAMLERTLLQNQRRGGQLHANESRRKRSVCRVVEQVDEFYMDASLTDVMLLGMGPDAHTLSWFKGGRGYEAAISPDSTSVVAAVEAIESEVTGPNLLRMTLTQPCVAYARNILLLITGAEKKAVFESAPEDAPVSIMKRAAGDSLDCFLLRLERCII